MTICDICKSKTYRFGNSGDWYCSNRTAESFLSCDSTTNWMPFAPKDGIPYERSEIVAKWHNHITKIGG